VCKSIFTHIKHIYSLISKPPNVCVHIGNFDSSNVVVNGGYELVKNAMVSNMLSVQSDCPHREKLP